MNTKRIHVVHIIPTLTFGGAERFVVDLINNADPERFKFSVIVFFPKTELAGQIRRADVQVIVVEKKGQLSFGLIKQLAHRLHELNPDIVHTHLFGGDVWGRLAAKRLKIPVVTTEHNINTAEGFWRNYLRRLLIQRSDFYIAASEAIGAYAQKTYHPNPGRTAVIRYGIELSKFLALPPPSFSDSLQLLLLGRLTAQKGHAIALQALARLTQYQWELRIVGNGELEKELKNLVKKLQLVDRVDFAPPTLDVPSVLQYNDLLLVPSLWEGLGIVAMEAMAAGRLVVGSNVGGIPELVEHSKTGYLSPPGDVDALASRLEYCFIHQEECRRVAAAGQAQAEKEFGVERMVRKYEEIYRMMVEKNRK